MAATHSLASIALIFLLLIGVLGDPDPPEITINTLFTVAPGTTNGGCDNRKDALETYLQESIDSLTTAVNAIKLFQEDPSTDDGKRIGSAIKTFFGYKNLNSGAANVLAVLNGVEKFFNNDIDDIKNTNTYLFCDSTWLEQKAPTDEAQDVDGDDVMDDDGVVAIENIPSFAEALKPKGTIPFWSGSSDDPIVRGYYFVSGDNPGDQFCSSPKNYGLTSTITPVTQGNGDPMPGDPVNNVILCPSSFGRTDVSDTYSDGIGAIDEGDTLEAVTPRSATLLHEAFHLVQGANFLEDDLGPVTNAALKANMQAKARKNPENYVYFTASMYYLFGIYDPDTDHNVFTKFWDFTKGPDMAKGPIMRDLDTDPFASLAGDESEPDMVD